MRFNKGFTFLKKKQTGFTLVELLVVIGILGILAASALLVINPVAQIQKANDSKRKADINELRAALEFHKIDEGVYPSDIYPSGCGRSLTNGSTVYVREMPCDPTDKTTPEYRYTPNASFTTYELVACLENENDKDKQAVASCPSGFGFIVYNP